MAAGDRLEKVILDALEDASATLIPGRGQTMEQATARMVVGRVREFFTKPEAVPALGGDFEFSPDENGKLTRESAIMQAVGAASMCWEFPDRAGVFQVERARDIGLALAAFLYQSWLENW